MELSGAVRGFEILFGWSLLLQTVEYLRIERLDTVGDWSVQRLEVPDSPRAARALLDLLLQPLPYRMLLLARLGLALWLIVGGLALGGALLLFGIALVLLMRWRGAFNGGSDFMTLVVLSGGLIAHVVGAWTHPEWGWQAGLWYISIHAISSYFMSGWVKLKHAHWRSGQALTIFLNGAIHGPLPPDSWFRKPWLARLSAWSFILWECAFPLALSGPAQAQAMCAVAGVFHFLVFWFFGLNRFFWAWVTCFPAVIYCADWKMNI